MIPESLDFYESTFFETLEQILKIFEIQHHKNGVKIKKNKMFSKTLLKEWERASVCWFFLANTSFIYQPRALQWHNETNNRDNISVLRAFH